MEIVYNIEDMGGQFDAHTPEELRDKLLAYYTVDGYSAEVTIDGDYVKVKVDQQDLEQSQQEFYEITTLCEKRQFNEAHSRLVQFLKKHSRHSEGYRILAQMEMEAGNIDKAIDINIEALRCDPKNAWALLLMGNLYSKYKDDYKVGRTYYDSVLKYSPDNFIAINNIAAIMMEKKDYDHAIPMFEQALKGDKKYANAYYGLAVCYYNQSENRKAFDTALQGCLLSNLRSENPQVMDELHKILIASAHAVVEYTNYMNVVLGIKDEIEMTYHQKIEIEEDDTLDLSAKLEYGPTHHCDYHLIKINPKKPFMEHLAIHEMMHLQMNLEADKVNKNRVIFSNNDNVIAFRTKYAAWIKKLVNRFDHSKAMGVVQQIHAGYMLQVMNCPLDLFVEKRMYDKYPIVRAIQLLSLMEQETYNIKAIKGSENAKFVPQDIVQNSKVMNIVSSMNFEHLFGLRFYQEYKPTKAQYDQAKDFYDEFMAYDDYTPGEEYELVEYFMDSFHMNDMMSMKPLNEYLDDSYERMEKTKMMRDAALGEDAPEGGNSFDGLTEEQKKKQDTFYAENKDGEDPMKTMMMSMYMLGALEYFDGMDKMEIKKIAFEIAMIGTTGISPDKKSGYKVPSIPGKDFGGYQLLAYYYVSWALAIPEMLASLNLPFDNAWAAAQQMWKKKKGNQ
ncbi:tetratricopeptide repeat protein [Prevotella copri]|uniref:Tetratricopeptide repeat protein n=1 Tax=Segatella copri TaxID=165179 RepID=A0A6I2U0A1_9BACT|nr:tetratricopeptide repeat protein [Segatella copri]MST78217.1 tetratricopeptide repeat protein [Segatella copri]